MEALLTLLAPAVEGVCCTKLMINLASDKL